MATVSEVIPVPDSGLSESPAAMYSMAGKDESINQQKRLSKTFPRVEQTSFSPKLSERLPHAPPPSTRGNRDQLPVTEHRTRPVSTLSSGYGSAVSNAVSELKEKAIYKAEIVTQYKWVSSTYGDFVLQVSGDIYVHVLR